MKLWALVLAAACSCAASDRVFVSRDGCLFLLRPRGEEFMLRAEHPAVSPAGDRVAFVRRRNELWLHELTERRERRLFQSAGRLSQPCWAPSGDRIAFVVQAESATAATMTLDLATMRAKTVGSAAAIFGLHWAADGVLWFHDLFRLYAVAEGARRTFDTAAVTGRAAAISSADRFVVCPADPGLIAFTCAVNGSRRFRKRFREPGSALFLYDSRRGTRRRLTPVSMFAKAPVWSPDGRRVYFSGFTDSDPDDLRIRVVDVKTLQIERIGCGEDPQPRSAGNGQ